MPVIYFNIAEQRSLEKEPYTTLTKRFKGLKYNLDGQEIEIKIASEKEGFLRGFYTDHEFTNDAVLRFVFAKVKSGKNSEATFVRMEFSFESNDDNYYFYQHHIKLLKKRVPYFYIPFASNFEFSHQVDEHFKMNFDILVENESDVLNACYSLLNQLIAIFSFED